MQMSRIVIFISGNGTNARNIIQHFYFNKNVKVVGVFSTISNLMMQEFCENQNIAYVECLQKPIHPSIYLDFCKQHKAGLIVLAGFLKRIPPELIEHYPKHILNIHPSLLPKFGGKGMYGMHVHQAVIEAKERVSGITIHYVNEEIDQGKHIAQFSTTLSPEETSDSLATKIHELEMRYFPVVIEHLLLNRSL